MYGCRAREANRQVMRKVERDSENALQHVKRTYLEMQTQKAMLPEEENKLDVLRKRLKTCQGPQDIREYYRIQDDIKQLEAKIGDVRAGKNARAFFERALPLLREPPKVSEINMEQKREALATVLFHKEKSVPVFIQTELCTTCGEELVIRAEESLDVCQTCRRTKRRFNMATEHVDVDYYAQDTHANHTKSTASGNMEANEDPLKPALFESFLAQFDESVDDPPQRILDVILIELSNVHAASGSKVQPTPIQTILKKKGLKEYVPMALRIAMLLRKKKTDAMPRFSKSLIARMMTRFIMFVDMVKKSKKSLKFMTRGFLQFLTRVFLILENEVAMSEFFDCHKTRSVHMREDRRVNDICKMLSKKTLNGFPWDYVRSL